MVDDYNDNYNNDDKDREDIEESPEILKLKEDLEKKLRDAKERAIQKKKLEREELEREYKEKKERERLIEIEKQKILDAETEARIQARIEAEAKREKEQERIRLAILHSESNDTNTVSIPPVAHPISTRQKLTNIITREHDALPKEGNLDVPEDISRYYPSQLEGKKIKKPLMCYLLDVDKKNNSRPTLVTKPIKKKYGDKWFMSGSMKYFINYNQIMNFGKHYAYLCQFGNAVGALSFFEYPEYADANQLELMTNQHAVEVFKKHKGISPKILLIIAIVCAVSVIGLIITIQFAIGATTAKDKLTAENNLHIAQLQNITATYHIPIPDINPAQLNPPAKPSTTTGGKK